MVWLPGGGTSAAHAINDLGQVAGVSDCGTECQHAVLWSKTKGSMLDLGVLPGASSTYSEGINNVGQVVGWAFYSLNDEHAFVWSLSTGMLDLNNLIPANSGWFLQVAYAINDKGQIVGEGTLNGQPEAFLLTTPSRSARTVSAAASSQRPLTVDMSNHETVFLSQFEHVSLLVLKSQFLQQID